MAEAADPIRERRRLATILWRWAFIAYGIALTVATHWPALDIGEPDMPSPDKIIHLYAFGGLTAFLWRTRWLRSVWSLLAVSIVWIVLDEWTQSLAFLERSFSWEDIAAGAAGSMIVAAWIAALRPIGGPANRARLDLQSHVFDDLFASLHNPRARLSWFILGVAFVPSGLALLRVWPVVVDRLPNPAPMMIYGVAQALLLGVLLALWGRLWLATMRETVRDRRCPHCGASCAGEPVDGQGRTACPECGSALHIGTWLEPLLPDGDLLRRVALKPAAVALGLTVAVYLLFALTYLAIRNEWFGVGGRAWERALNTLTDDFVITLDLACLLLIGALALYLTRRNLARLYDRQHIICRACGHDLRATPIDHGLGTCGECGTTFARFEDDGRVS